ncbi:hypothetical protein O7598_20325 [Micromonospora sp. WMMC241]|uniref:hypothetical protein n=1 Tax=Micromonospora sp. WMMC241 TaxID=3015159 RepID=UPI0022B61574|nr:hypothetical protein [Micromonospora sp. WMMC241]MCZ7438770.1 hypothetical protein [Micromonospora sp. WMMC241]
MSEEQAEAWRVQAVEGRDPRAAFALGALHLDRSGADGEARRWFEYATTLDPSADLLWQITREHVDTLALEPIRTWMRRAITAEWAGCEFTVDPGVFGVYDYHGTGDVTGQAFEVQVSAEPAEAARTALEAAALRFPLVNEIGVECEEYDDELYTPNYVSDVRDDVAGPWLGMDCKDGVMPLMARTDIRIVVEELRRAGATSGRIFSPSNELLDWYPADR